MPRARDGQRFMAITFLFPVLRSRISKTPGFRAPRIRSARSCVCLFDRDLVREEVSKGRCPRKSCFIATPKEQELFGPKFQSPRVLSRQERDAGAGLTDRRAGGIFWKRAAKIACCPSLHRFRNDVAACLVAYSIGIVDCTLRRRSYAR